MTSLEKITIVGAGAIGCSLAVKMAQADYDVTLIVRQSFDACSDTVSVSLSEEGKRVSTQIKISQEITNDPDFIIVTVKNQDLQEVFNHHYCSMKGKNIVLIQNGVSAKNEALKFFDESRIISSVVLYNSYLSDRFCAEITKAKPIMLSTDSRDSKKFEKVLLNSQIDYIPTDNIVAVQYSKLVVNSLTNSLEGISGMNIKKLFEYKEFRMLGVLMLREMFQALEQRAIPVTNLPEIPVKRLRLMVHLPLFLSEKILGFVVRKNTNEKIVTSTLQDLKNGKKTEIDFLNGVFVRLNKDHSDVNKSVISMINEIEKGRGFYTAQEVSNSLLKPVGV